MLRINSPGGSAVASDMIAREVQLLRDAGKPVVACMGDVAASGGYYIAGKRPCTGVDSAVTSRLLAAGQAAHPSSYLQKLCIVRLALCQRVLQPGARVQPVLGSRTTAL